MAKKEKAFTLEEVKTKLEGVPEDKHGALVCALLDHSSIVEACFGYIYCARCRAQIGDTLCSNWAGGPHCVLVGHDCEVCRTNFAKLDWKDTFLTPDPFAKS